MRLFESLILLCLVDAFPVPMGMSPENLVRNLPKLQIYLSKGGNPDATGFDKMTLLANAVYLNQLNSVELLLGSGAKIDCQFEYQQHSGHTALMVAAER